MSIHVRFSCIRYHKKCVGLTNQSQTAISIHIVEGIFNRACLSHHRWQGPRLAKLKCHGCGANGPGLVPATKQRKDSLSTRCIPKWTLWTSILAYQLIGTCCTWFTARAPCVLFTCLEFASPALLSKSDVPEWIWVNYSGWTSIRQPKRL